MHYSPVTTALASPTGRNTEICAATLLDEHTIVKCNGNIFRLGVGLTENVSEKMWLQLCTSLAQSKGLLAERSDNMADPYAPLGKTA